ncbi:MAG: hypothetical protein NZ898_11905 [Myxococcota bacterium]|nr:hypothetical protein [Myxococcota bacterium]MDW8363390.1 hypothetical protein [Myxococcales bacterium]
MSAITSRTRRQAGESVRGATAIEGRIAAGIVGPDAGWVKRASAMHDAHGGIEVRE